MEPPSSAPTFVATPEAIRLPEDFQARVEALSATTVVHIPVALRAAHCDIATRTLGGALAGRELYRKLEQARAKLLLAPMPKGASQVGELRTRIETWTAGDYEGLLERIEQQKGPHRGEKLEGEECVLIARKKG